MAWHRPIPGTYPNGTGDHSFAFTPPPPAFAEFIRFLESGARAARTGHHHSHFPPGFPFGTRSAWGPRGRCARARGRGASAPHSVPPSANAEAGPTPARDAPCPSSDPETAQDPPEVTPNEEPEQPPPYGARAHDPASFLRSFASHPFAQNLLAWLEQARDSPESRDTFTPPLDLFYTDTSYVLHVALPGAKKEDIGVSWDADKSELSIAGVVHRPGDEAFQRGLVSGERRVGVFERVVKLPPAAQQEGAGSEEGKEEIDREGITARMEDGVLVVDVPRVEKGWTEVRKVDIG